MRTIIEALKADKVDRITSNDGKRWLYWSGNSPFDGESNRWHVRTTKRPRSVLILQTDSEEEAVKILIGEDK